MKLNIANSKKRFLLLTLVIVSASAYGFLLRENQKLEEKEEVNFKEVVLENESLVPAAFLVKKVFAACAKLYK